MQSDPVKGGASRGGGPVDRGAPGEAPHVEEVVMCEGGDKHVPVSGKFSQMSEVLDLPTSDAQPFSNMTFSDINCPL